METIKKEKDSRNKKTDVMSSLLSQMFNSIDGCCLYGLYRTDSDTSHP